jgi:hypothetical protein
MLQAGWGNDIPIDLLQMTGLPARNNTHNIHFYGYDDGHGDLPHHNTSRP